METSVVHLPWKKTEIILCGDIHWGCDACEKDLFRRFVKAHKEAHWWLLGDPFDLAPTSNRMKIRSCGLNDGVLDRIEKAHREDVEELAKLLATTNVEGLISGNHYWQFEDGQTSDTMLADMLGAVYLGDCALVVVEFSRRSPHKNSVPIRIFLHHGTAVGRKVSAPLNRLQDLVAEQEADIYATGHAHKSPQAPIDRIYTTDNGHLYHRTKRLLAVGSFYRSYLQHSMHGDRLQGSYAEKKLLAPSTLGCPNIIVTPHNDGHLSLVIGQESDIWNE